jgi:LL-diaminopimelate aminotransferase
MKKAKRIERLSPYLFVEINRKIAEKRQAGEDVVSFAVGDPDMPTPEHIIKALHNAADEPENHRYPTSSGMPELKKAIADWYQKRFNVKLDPETEVLPLIGAKEGIAHVPFCFLDPGDFALVPDPGYPVYSIGAQLAGARPYFLNLKESNGFIPGFNGIREQVLEKTGLLWLNYPNNPTGAVAGLDFFNQAAEFGKTHNILVCHDAAYSEVAYDGYQPASFLQAEGAMETGIEIHSFSKTYSMTGWRIGSRRNAEASMP